MASGDRVPSARSIKSPIGELEVLPSEGSAVYITEVKCDDSSPKQSVAISDSNTLIGIPRKANDHSENQPKDLSSDCSNPPSPQTMLRNAGVDIDLSTMLPNGNSAPLELLSEFTSCVMREEYEAAKLLCEKILEFEPTNEIVVEFLPVIMERLKLDAELSSEESSDSGSESDSEEASSDESTTSEDSSDIDTLPPASHRHCTYHSSTS